MANNNFGEIDWVDDFGGEKKFVNSKDLWLRLSDGTNELRLVTRPHQYLVHKVKKDPNDKKDFGQKVHCSAVNGSCPLCEEGDKAKRRWLLGVISRKDGTYKILDISWAVFSQIQKLAKNTTRFGDPTKYDINIEVCRDGGATGYYTVQPLPKEALSAADQALRDNADLTDLQRRVTPPTAEAVQARADKIRGGTEGTVKATIVKPSVKPSVKTAPVSITEDEDDSFPSYDQPA